MIRFSANLTLMFTEMPLEDRFAAAADAGFAGVEMPYPYDVNAHTLRELAQRAELEFVRMNTPPPNWSGGHRGFAAVPGLEQRFRDDFVRALRYSQALRNRHIHLIAGQSEGPAAKACLISNLTWAVARAPHVSLTIGPVDHQSQPGCFLSDYAQTCAIIDEINAPNLGLQFDTYHAEIITGDAFAAWQQVAPYVRHVHMSGFPGRNEPDIGEFDYLGFVKLVRGSVYQSWIGAEYTPVHLTEHGLNWMKNLRLRGELNPYMRR